MSSGRTIVVGITGGIAAYKAVGIVRAFVLLGHSVHVVATEAALRFVGKPTLEAISRNPVHTDLYDGVAEVRHVAIGQSADLIVVAPATANSIAKLAAGLADDLLGTTILASKAPLVVAPAMHTEMWENPATVANVNTLRERGITIVGPGVGRLTGRDIGPGRMEEPDTIVAAALAVLEGGPAGHTDAGEADLTGMRVVVTAGGTREPLDPVRFLGNRSSGKQGIALAEEAARRGAAVTVIAAHLEVPPPQGVALTEVSTARELGDAVMAAAAGADVLIMAAAVADYRPAETRDGKIRKEETGDALTLSLVKNPDILATLAASPHRPPVLVGFAAETEQDTTKLLVLGREKIARKGVDYLVMNRVGWNQGFARDTNEVLILDTVGDIVAEASGSKMSVAGRILDAIIPVSPVSGDPAASAATTPHTSQPSQHSSQQRQAR